MNAALEATKKSRTPRLQGRVIARAPEAGKQGNGPLTSVTPPVDALKSDLSVSQRWRVIVEVVLGRGTGAPFQIGVILVGIASLWRCKHVHRLPHDTLQSHGTKNLHGHLIYQSGGRALRGPLKRDARIMVFTIKGLNCCERHLPPQDE